MRLMQARSTAVKTMEEAPGAIRHESKIQDMLIKRCRQLQARKNGSGFPQVTLGVGKGRGIRGLGIKDHHARRHPAGHSRLEGVSF